MGLYINCSYFSTYNWYDSGQNCTKNCFITPISLRFIGDISIVNGLTTVSAWWFGTCFIFPYIGNVIIPTDELIFFRLVETTNQVIISTYSYLPHLLSMVYRCLYRGLPQLFPTKSHHGFFKSPDVSRDL